MITPEKQKKIDAFWAQKRAEWRTKNCPSCQHDPQENCPGQEDNRGGTCSHYKSASILLCSWGYQSRGYADLQALVRKHQIGLVVDVRRRAWAKHQPEWRLQNLRESWREFYVHCPELGNGHKALPWKECEGWEGGIEAVCHELEKHSVLLFCLERDPARCHRSDVAQVVAEKVGCQVKHLGWEPKEKPVKQAPVEVPAKKPSAQMELFG